MNIIEIFIKYQLTSYIITNNFSNFYINFF